MLKFENTGGFSSDFNKKNALLPEIMWKTPLHLLKRRKLQCRTAIFLNNQPNRDEQYHHFHI